MAEETVLETWDEFLAVEDTDYATVEIGKKRVRLGSLSSAQMIGWIEDNEDEAKHKINGLTLVAMSLVNARGERIGKVTEMLKLRDKNPRTVRTLVNAALELNKLKVKEELKNDSGEAVTDASPSDSPAPSVS